MSSASTANSARRFAIVGVGNFAVSFAVFYVSYRYLPLDALARVLHIGRAGVSGTPPDAAIANVLAYLAGMVHSFAWNRAWTFRSAGNAALQAWRFTVVNLATLVYGTALVYVFVDVLRYHALVVWFPVTATTIVLNYLGCKHWAFAQPATLRTGASV
jgi:putative flippase GtrA